MNQTSNGHLGSHAIQRRSPKVPVSVTLEQMFKAWTRARRRKKASFGMWQFERCWIDNLVELTESLNTGNWLPHHTTCFVVSRPKTREIHAPQFSDRVVHHWLVPELETVFERLFIHDSFGNRKGKGLHAGVNRLQEFARQFVDGKGGGYAIKLDIRNCFNRIHRPTLYRLIVKGLDRSIRTGNVTAEKAYQLRSLCHKLLSHPIDTHYINREQHEKLPQHKRLDQAPMHCGIPIGNLTSQFFVNVYLNVLDQYIKHELKIKHYVRYVDDMVLVACDPDQAIEWRNKIDIFLQNSLKLSLRDDQPIYNLYDGIPFLGFRVYPHHRLVLRRSVQHFEEFLRSFESLHVRIFTHSTSDKRWLCWETSADALRALRQTVASYWGHFNFAASSALRKRIFEKFIWMGLLFERSMAIKGRLKPRWILEASGLMEQRLAAENFFAGARGTRSIIWIQCGFQWQSAKGKVDQSKFCMLANDVASWEPTLRCDEVGWLRHGARERWIVAGHVLLDQRA